MNLKNAAAVCLISLFSATLVVLIARALDMQAASRLEPQLTKIAEELEAIRKSGGLPAASDGTAAGQSVADGLMVYYFHGKVRCPTCRAIESQSHETVQTEFASELANGEVVWKIINYEQPAGEDLAKEFDVDKAVVVLARMKDGQTIGWKRLDKVWALVGDKPAFAAFIRDEITQMLGSADEGPSAASSDDLPLIPLPDFDPNDIPLPIPSTGEQPQTPPAEVEMPAAPEEQVKVELVNDGLAVYYFHGHDRCPTCRAIESQSHETVEVHFAPQLASGAVAWRTLNYEDPAVAELKSELDIQYPVVALVTMNGGKIEAWKTLDDVWPLVDDKPAFTEYVRHEISQMLETGGEGPAALPNDDGSEIRIRQVDPKDRPIPTAPLEIPVPQ